MRTFDLTFTPGETKVVPGGIFLVVISATNPISIDYFVNGTNNNENAVNVESGYYYENINGGFTSARITSATAQTIKVAVSRGKGGYSAGASSLVGGTIDTVSNGEVWQAGDVTVEAGLQGLGFIGQQTTGTDKTSVYLFNPDASGRNLYLKKISLMVIDGGTPPAFHNILFESSVGAPGAWVAGSQYDKRINTYSIVGQVYGLGAAAAFGATGSMFAIRDNIEFVYEFNTPFKLVPNRYFGLGTNTVNRSTFCSFEWFERAV